MGSGRLYVEVRGLAGPHFERVARAILEALREVPTVQWAAPNGVLGYVVVACEDPAGEEHAVVEAVEAAEAATGTAGQRFPDRGPGHPGDPEPVRRQLVALAADVAGLGWSVVAQALRFAPLPAEAAFALSLFEDEPRLARLAAAVLGRRGADLGVALASATAQALAQGPLGLLVDALRRASLAGELDGRRRAFLRREAELSRDEAAAGATPVPSIALREPRGPVETAATRQLIGALGASVATLGLTGDARRAADVALAGTPKAARLGREAFAAWLGRDLAAAGVVVLDPSALRRLERVDTVVLDGRVLDAARRAPGAPGVPGPDSLAEEFVARVREAGHEFLVAGARGARALRADGALPTGRRLGAALRALREEGRCVVAVGHDGAALAAADCGVALAGGPRVGWGAHLIGGADLGAALKVVDATIAARAVARTGVALGAAGSAVGVASVLLGPRLGAGRRALLPVNAAALGAEAVGIFVALELGRRPAPVSRDPTRWEELEVDEVLERLRTSAAGLGAAEAARRRASAGAAPAQGGLGRAVLKELATPLTPVLALGAGLSAAVGSLSDAVLIGGVVSANAAIAAAQRVRTEQALARLIDTSATRARVLRPEGEELVAAERLVLGDVVVLGAGEVVPADCRVLEAAACEVDESSLTGEPWPVPKDPAPTPGAAFAERRCMLYQGTTVVSGSVTAVVCATGAATEAGRSVAAAGRTPPQGVEARLAGLSRVTVPATVAAGALVAGLGVLRGRGLREAVGSGVSLTVAAVPEGLPLVATVAQLGAARRLSERGALVRNPRALEALGRVDLLCFDKTGTLTEGRIALARVSDGASDAALGDLGPRHRRVLAAALRASPEAAEDAVLPHATDQAVVDAARAVGVGPGDGLGGWEVTSELPFEPGRGFHASAGRGPNGALLAVKGAPEAVLARCASWLGPEGSVGLEPAVLRALQGQVEALAAAGFRVLAVAERAASGRRAVSEERVRSLELLGFLGFSDLVRPTAARAVEQLRRAGVDVAMITGDHPSTAEAIAAELGILDGRRVVTGAQLDALGPDELRRLLPQVSVFARVTPTHKVRIVEALQAAGRVVAMTGDGANDAPAIRLAHAGVALGGRSSAAARDAADVVVVDDRIETVVDAIVEGRAMWVSVRDALAILLGGNLGEVAFTLVGSALGGQAPLGSRQLLLVNLLTDMLPAMAVAMRPPPQRTAETLLAEGPEASLGSALASEVALRAATTAAGATVAFAGARLTGPAARARTTGLVALVGTQLGQTLVAGGSSPVVVASVLGSAAALGAIVQTPGLSGFFGCVPLDPGAWALALGSAAGATGLSVLAKRLVPGLARSMHPQGALSSGALLDAVP